MNGKNFVKCSDDSRLANTSFGGNGVSRIAMRSERKDIFLLSRGNRMHDELRDLEKIECAYMVLYTLPYGCNSQHLGLCALQQAVCTAIRLYLHCNIHMYDSKIDPMSPCFDLIISLSFLIGII